MDTDPNVDITESKQTSIIVQTAIVVPLSLIFTILRFISRRKQRAGYWWDDWMILAATVLNIGFTVVSALVISYGLGKHIQAIGISNLPRFLLAYYAGQIFYTCVIAAVKYSILALYWRVFGRDIKPIRPPLYILLGMITAWFITTLCGCLFGCEPISFAWDTAQAGTCIDKKAFFLAVSIVNTITDIALLALPIYHVVNLQMRREVKALLCVAFLLGGFVCIVTFVRIGVLVNTDFGAVDQSWIETTFAEWTNIECNVAIISACLPCLRPLLGKWGSQTLPTPIPSPDAASRRRSRGSHAPEVQRVDSAFAAVRSKGSDASKNSTPMEMNTYWIEDELAGILPPDLARTPEELARTPRDRLEALPPC